MKKLVFIIFVLWIWIGCDVEDKGHYNYIDVNEVEISGVETEYTGLSFLDSVNITPKLAGSIDGENDANYDFCWYICSGNDHEHTVLSTEKDLHWRLDVPAGQYTLYFQVTDRMTGLQWFSRVLVTVATEFTRGFLLFGNTESGEARLDMIMMPMGKDTAVAEGIFDNSTLHLAHARNMIFTGNTGVPASNNLKALYLMTEKKDVKLTSGTYFESMGDFNELGIIQTDVEHSYPMRIMDVFPRQWYRPMNESRAHRSRGYITEDMILVTQMTTTEILTTAINRYSQTSTEYFKPYPWAWIRGTSSYTSVYPIFYDMDNERFVKPMSSSSGSYGLLKYCQIMSDFSWDPFPWDQKSMNIPSPRTIVYGENAFDAGNTSYALMKDETGTYFIYAFQCWTNSLSSPNKLGCYTVDQSVAQHFGEASLFAFSSAKNAIAYAVGSKLWLYDFSRNQSVSIDLGAEICCLEQDWVSAGSLTDLIVATYDAGSERGAVQKLRVGGGTNLTIEPIPNNKWEVTMKVKAIEWKYSGDSQLEETMLEENQ